MLFRSLGAVAVNKGDGTVALGAGDMPASAIVTVLHDGTRFRLIDPATADAISAPWVDLASAATTDLSTVSSNVRITGTTTITAFGTAGSGITRQLRFAAALTLTHNATSLILPGGANITTAAGDTAMAISLGSGNWVVMNYTRASGLLLGPAGTAAAPSISFSGDSDTGAYNPGANRLGFTTNGAAVGEFNGSDFQFNSGYGSVATAYGCRAWVNFNGTGTVAIRASGNVSSITDNGVGDYTANFTNAMPDANYCAVVSAAESASATARPTIRTPADLTSSNVRVIFGSGGANVDPGTFCVAIFR